MEGALQLRPAPRYVRAARRALWLTLLRAMPLMPRGARTLRERIIEATRLAPLELIIAKGDTVVLVGVVPTGELWSMVRLVGPRGRVIAVEPFPESVSAIEERARRERVKNLTVIAKGAWSEPGRQRLYIHPEFSGSHIVLDSGAKHDRAMRPEDYAGSIDIDVDRLDTILASHGIEKCDLIKITVMGAESQVLKGMERLMSVTPRLWVKAHSLLDGRPANAAIAKILEHRGYRTLITRGNQGPGGVERPGDVYATRSSGAPS